MRTLGKRVMQQCIRGFESLSVRQFFETLHANSLQGFLLGGIW